MTTIVPISLKQANEYVTNYHRHHKAVRGCKFCIALKSNNGEIIGVAICGRPVSRYYDDGKTIEINRLCTNGYKNAFLTYYRFNIDRMIKSGYTEVEE